MRPSPLRTPPTSLAGSGADRGWGVPPNPHQKGLRPLWTLPLGGERSGQGLGGTPKPPPKRAASSGLSRLAGSGAGGIGGYPPKSHQEGCALSGLSRWAGSGADRGWGVPLNPHQRGLRSLWTLLPDGGFCFARAAMCRVGCPRNRESDARLPLAGQLFEQTAHQKWILAFAAMTESTFR